MTGSGSAHHTGSELSPDSTETAPNSYPGSRVSRNRRPSASASASSPNATRRSEARAHPQGKVSRACDRCKSRKQKCNGTQPCRVCSRKGIECHYNTAYRRGRPPTPPPPSNKVSEQTQVAESEKTSGTARSQSRLHLDHRIGLHARLRHASSSLRESPHPPGGLSRASPELETTEIDGQFFDPTSNLTFLHRAWKRLSKGGRVPGVPTDSVGSQPVMSAGDRPFAFTEQPFILPDRSTVVGLFEFYFERCVVTYRCLHRQYCAGLMDSLVRNAENNLPLHHDIGHAKAALVMTILAIATHRQENISGNSGIDSVDGTYLWASDQLFCAASNLISIETGLAQLESVQARILQVLYLLQTGRMNQAWYVFGSTVPMSSALGLHRRSGRTRNGARSPSSDYIVSQCRKRTFWVVYIIDKYLAVVLGRPRLYHDDDIDQDYPDRVNDEDMSAQGPASSEPTMDCHIDSLILHAKIALIIDNISREVYSLKRLPKTDRLAAARHFGRRLSAWRDSLPAHLGTIRPLSLIPVFRRQAMALKLAYSHAIIHANRPFLLGGIEAGEEGLWSSEVDESVRECIGAAKMALELVDSIADDGSLFHAFWWMPYVTFCALAVVYVWEIQHRTSGAPPNEDTSLFNLADRCQNHLARSTAADSPSRRYSIILEELRLEARGDSISHQPSIAENNNGIQSAATHTGPATMSIDFSNVMPDQSMTGFIGIHHPLAEWQASDWLDLDSSAFGPFPHFEPSPDMWMGEIPSVDQ